MVSETRGKVAKTLRELRTRAGLSRDELGKLTGNKNGKYLQFYEDPERYSDDYYPVDLVAKLAAALIGRGTPPIEPQEVWGLAKMESGLTVIPAAVVTIPIVRWEMIKTGAVAVLLERPTGALQIVGLESGKYLGLQVDDFRCAQIAPPGSTIVVDLAQTELRDGQRFLVILNGEPQVRLYRSNPARFESVATPATESLSPNVPVDVIGRVIRSITQL